MRALLEHVQTSGLAAACVALAVLGGPGWAAAQADMDFTQEGEGEGEGGTDMDFTQEGEQPAEGEEGQPAEGGDVIEGLAEAEADITEAEGPERAEEAREQIFAVQQIYALRINRVEIFPSFAQTLNDPFVSHPAISLGLNYWFTNVLAVGVNFLWYEGLENESGLNFFVRRSTRLAVPVSAYQFGAHLAFTYVPIYGKFAMFNEFIFQWDSYIVGGVGLMRTRPIPVVDPEVRRFDYDIRVAFNLGIGLRVFVSRWFAIFGEVRNYMYLEQLEALDVGLGDARFQEETWTQDTPAFTSNFTVHVGFTIFLPFEFDYRLPR
jgi:outer membrane beta-barrel protein